MDMGVEVDSVFGVLFGMDSTVRPLHLSRYSTFVTLISSFSLLFLAVPILRFSLYFLCSRCKEPGVGRMENFIYCRLRELAWGLYSCHLYVRRVLPVLPFRDNQRG